MVSQKFFRFSLLNRLSKHLVGMVCFILLGATYYSHFQAMHHSGFSSDQPFHHHTSHQHHHENDQSNPDHDAHESAIFYSAEYHLPTNKSITKKVTKFDIWVLITFPVPFSVEQVVSKDFLSFSDPPLSSYCDSHYDSNAPPITA